MTTTTVPAPSADSVDDAPVFGPLRQSRASAFGALLLRDLTVLRKNLKEFLPRTIIQPFLLVFVFTYVFPKIGQGVGGGGGSAAAATFSSILVAGVLGTAIIFQGIQAVALPLVQEFGYTREIEDRVLAPLPISLVAIEKIVAGALQCLFAGIIVFPIATIVPATAVHLDISWPILLTLVPLGCIMSGALGLMFGTMFDPRTVPMLFGVILIPITFLGCTYYSWQALEPIRWLQIGTLINPLVYLAEGFRAALTPVPHMNLVAVYGVLLGFTAVFTWLGIKGFTKRVIA
ncbi:MAG TPA: ABC transporter permease [Iamia sp.]|jgi:ABC-2 type transport system permease protein|nr:ABC transporter permease [Iamia sp.]